MLCRHRIKKYDCFPLKINSFSFRNGDQFGPDLAWWERIKRIAFLRRAARARSFSENLKGPEKSRAALFLPHPISQAAFTLLPLLLLAVRCRTCDVNALSFPWIAFKCVQENSSDTLTSKMPSWSRSLHFYFLKDAAFGFVLHASLTRTSPTLRGQLLLFAPPK